MFNTERLSINSQRAILRGRGMNFTWIDEFDAGCIDPLVNAISTRIAKVRWLEKSPLGFETLEIADGVDLSIARLTPTDR